MKCRMDYLLPGNLPFYAKKVGTSALCVGEEGQNILCITNPRRVILPLFDLSSGCEVHPESEDVEGARKRLFETNVACLRGSLKERLDVLRETVKEQGIPEDAATLIITQRTVQVIQTEKISEMIVVVGMGVVVEDPLTEEEWTPSRKAEGPGPEVEACFDDFFPFELVKTPCGANSQEESARILKEFFGMTHC